MSTIPKVTPDRVAELQESLQEIRSRVQKACKADSTDSSAKPTLVAVSKLKPAADIVACYEDGQRDFGENYVQELEEKAAALQSLSDIRWHFIGTLQSNKAKNLALIPNLYSIQTLNSVKAATALNKHISTDRLPLNVLLQVNTSGEDAKSGLQPLSPDIDSSEAELTKIAWHIVKDCPRLRLQGLMTIGSLTESLHSEEKPNQDFERLVRTRNALQDLLRTLPDAEGKWGVDGKLLLSMGMSSDFEAALKAGSDIVRVGTGIFGSRPKKGQPAAS